MKKTLLIFGLLTAGLTCYSQITITSADMPSPDDTVMVSISTQYATVDFTSTGANHVWDFSGLVSDSQKIDTFYDVSGSSLTYQAVFNNQFTNSDYASDYYNTLSGNAIPAVPGGVVTIENPVFFTKNSSVSSSIVGLGLEINGVKVPAQADSIDVVYEFPMNYNDAWDSTSYIYLDLNPAFDGIFKRHQSRSSEVDGWGEIITPFGTFDVLRVKSTVVYTDSIYVDLFGTGGSWTGLATPQDVEYTWWANDNKMPVLKIVEQGGTPNRIEYRDHEVVIDDSGVEENGTIQFGLFPNPASNMVTISMNEKSSTMVEIMDITGKIVYSDVATNNNHQLDLSSWEKGVYLVRLTTDNKVNTQSLILE